jgi:segregation and condensation protein B
MNAPDYARLLHDAGTADATDTLPAVERIIEALLFAGGQPLTAEQAGQIIRGLDADHFQSAIDALNREYRKQSRPYTVQLRPDGYVLALLSQYEELRERLLGGPKAARLSVPALDVLACVAYKQPVTRSEIDALRGYDSANLLRQLVRLGLITVQDNVPGTKEPAYFTTPRFLEVFGLRSLDDLPQTSDLQKI